jgi:glycosyltransferase involved in cell wall biosynthesis
VRTVHDSLSVVLPVHNDPDSLNRRVRELLELLPELTPDFEILIVDQGSTDRTEEVAHEWAIRYPQLRAICQAPGAEHQDLLRLGLGQTRGEFVLVYDERAPVRLSQLRRMWELRGDRRLVMARSSSAAEPSLIQRLASWARQLPSEAANTPPGLRLIRRSALSHLGDEVHQVSLGDPRSCFTAAEQTASTDAAGV